MRKVRATHESDADAVTAATVGLILHARPIPELFRTVPPTCSAERGRMSHAFRFFFLYESCFVSRRF